MGDAEAASERQRAKVNRNAKRSAGDEGHHEDRRFTRMRSSSRMME